MFDISLLWIWILIYVICLVLWIIFRKYEGFLMYILASIGVIGCVFCPIMVGGILGEEFNNLFAIVPSLLMLCLFFSTTRDNSDYFFSKETLKNFLKFVLIMLFLGVFVLSFAIDKEEGFFIEILSKFLTVFSVIGLFATISSLQNDK